MHYTDCEEFKTYMEAKGHSIDSFVKYCFTIFGWRRYDHVIKAKKNSIEEKQHSFEILINALVHAQSGQVQPEIITLYKLKL
jgi:hypothetical protein